MSQFKEKTEVQTSMPPI